MVPGASAGKSRHRSPSCRRKLRHGPDCQIFPGIKPVLPSLIESFFKSDFMMKRTVGFSMLLMFMSTLLFGAEEQTFSSGPQTVPLLELFSSEGCSSCPPAEAWLNELENQKGLWTSFVPVAFHVDYWDRLGWKDPFARAAFTERQKSYSSLWQSQSIYTPNMVWNGKDWRDWGRAGSLPDPVASKPGILKAIRAKDGSVRILFAPAEKWNGGIARVALLGSGLKSDIKRGENSGRVLQHGFVALDYRSAVMQLNQEGMWEAVVPKLEGAAPKLALAVWVESAGLQIPVQAGGGWLK